MSVGRGLGVLKQDEFVECIREGWVPSALSISAGVICDVLDVLPHALRVTH